MSVLFSSATLSSKETALHADEAVHAALHAATLTLAGGSTSLPARSIRSTRSLRHVEMQRLLRRLRKRLRLFLHRRLKTPFLRHRLHRSKKPKQLHSIRTPFSRSRKLLRHTKLGTRQIRPSSPITSNLNSRPIAPTRLTSNWLRTKREAFLMRRRRHLARSWATLILRDRI